MSDREQSGNSAVPAQPGAGRGRGEATLAELTAAAARGDQRAFEALHRRVGAGLRRLLMKRSGARAELVDDLMQTTWASVWHALQSGRYDPGRAAITTFVYAVGNNAWFTHLRRFSREQGQPRAADDAPPADQPGAFDDAMGEAEAIDAVRACLADTKAAGLSDQERTILRFIAAGETDRGLARRLGISCSTVNVRKHAGLAKIRDHLERRGLGDPDRAAVLQPEQGAATPTARGKPRAVRPGIAGGAP